MSSYSTDKIEINLSMRINPKLSWFATDKGKATVFLGSCISGCGILAVNFLPQTYLQEKFKDIVQLYRKGEGVPVPVKVLSRAESVIKTLNVPEEQKNSIKFFTVYGFDPYFSGSPLLRTGSYIGIPISYNYDKIADVEKQQITVRGEPVNWSSKPAKELLNSLVLSENAQKFAIATQIHQACTHHVYLNSLTACTCFLATYSFAHAANRRLDGFSRPLPFRLILYTLIGSFMAGVWALTKDLTTSNLEYNADKEVAMLSLDYAQGGLEFYEQVLKRNKSLRELMGSIGESLFAASGNNQVFIRTKHLPITLRRDFLKEIVKQKLEESKTEVQ